MVYANINILDPKNGQRYSVKIVADSVEAANDYRDTIVAFGDQVIDIFLDEDFGDVCVLSEDFQY